MTNRTVTQPGSFDALVDEARLLAAYPELNVSWFGAKGDGSADDTAAIQAAIDALPTNGGSVIFPAGTFNVTSTITINRSNVDVRGQGFGSCVRAAAGAEGIDIFTCGNGVTQRNWLTFQNLRVSSVNYKTSNNGFKINKCFGVWLRNVYTDRQYRGIWVLNTHQFTMKSGDLRDFKEHGVVVETDYRAAVEWRFIDVWMDNPNVVNTGAGIWWLGGEGLYVQHVTIQRCNFGFLVAPDSNKECRWGFIEGLLCDSNLDTGIKVTNAGAPYGDVHGITFVDCWSATHPNYGFLIEKPGASEVTTVRLIGCKVMHNGLEGIRITGGKDGSVDDCDVFSNSDTTPNTKDGIFLNDGVGEWAFRNNRCGNGADHGATQRYGIVTGVGAGNYIMIVGNDCRNNSTGAILYLATGVNNLVAQNLGYNPRGALGPPAVPASTVALTNPYGVDCTVHITGGTVSAIAVGGTATGLTSGSFRVPAGQTITLTYTGAPSWTWFGD